MCMIIIPILCEVLPVYYFNTYGSVKIIILVHTCLLMLWSLIVPIKIWTDGKWSDVDDFMCPNLTRFKKLFLAGNLLYVGIPWVLTNIICIGIWGEQLKANDAWIIVLGTFALLFLFLFGIGIGYSITEVHTDNCRKYIAVCSKRIMTVYMYMVLIIAPIIFEAYPIIYYQEYYVTKITIIVFSSLLMVLSLATGIKLWIDVDKDEKNNHKPNFNEFTNGMRCDSFCMSPANYKSLLTGGYWFCIFMPLFIVNIVCIGFWWKSLLVANDIWIIIIGIPVPVGLFLIGLGIGYSIAKEFN